MYQLSPLAFTPFRPPSPHSLSYFETRDSTFVTACKASYPGIATCLISYMYTQVIFYLHFFSVASLIFLVKKTRLAFSIHFILSQSFNINNAWKFYQNNLRNLIMLARACSRRPHFTHLKKASTSFLFDFTTFIDVFC